MMAADAEDKKTGNGREMFGRETMIRRVFLGLLLVALLFSWSRIGSPDRTTTLMVRPVGVMGTSCSLCVTVRNRDIQVANALLKEAERELRRHEQFTSTWIETSEISRLNRAKAGETLTLSPVTLAFLREARNAFDVTHGAFDVTCGKLWMHWNACEKEGRMPTRAELVQIRKNAGWNDLEIDGDRVTKRSDHLCFVTGGLAKGMAVDAALRILASDPAVCSAFVEVGGDLATYRSSIPIEIADPVSQEPGVPEKPGGHGESGKTGNLTEKRTLRVENGGVCTSGHHVRFFKIQGQRFSQILDPSDGWPVPDFGIVTVTAPSAAEADYWATALSILGERGLEFLPENVKAEFGSVHRSDGGSSCASVR